MRRAAVGLLLALLVGGAASLSRADAAEKPATVKVSGYGLLGNRELRDLLKLVTTEKQPLHFDATFVEDAALVLLSRATRDGFLNARVTARLTLADGRQLVQVWDKELAEFLPRPLRVKRVHLIVNKGVLFYYRQLRLVGLVNLRQPLAREYFVDADFLLPLKRARVFTPARLEQSLASLREAYERLGYADAAVRVTQLRRDDQAGTVTAEVTVEEGPQRIVRSVQVQTRTSSQDAPHRRQLRQPQRPLTRAWQQDLVQRLRAEQYQQGYPDATAIVTVAGREQIDGKLYLDLLAQVQTGPHISVGALRFVGNERTRDSVMARRVKVEPGEPLNRLEVERGRYRLSRLGIFDLVNARYEAVDESTRDVIYEVDEGKRIDFSLMAGFGSYELLRGGLLLDQFNLFGRAHTSRLRLTQSFKSTRGDYLYTMPELIGEDVNVFVDASGLRREEISFTREEYSSSLGAQRRLASIQTDASLRYKYQFVTATDVPGIEDTVRRARVGAVTLDLRHDQRDDPLLPRRGYKLAGNFELASVGLGGEVDYQRFDIDSSTHLRLGRGRYLHLGLNHGVVLTLGGDASELPFNKRFFPGGESSVRGFQQGEAAPRDRTGRVIGAETYTQANLEFEQLLTSAWSVVLFTDAVGFAREVGDYPVEQALFSAGGGIRFKTIVGPVRLEYGRNLNPRRFDPDGTLHFSLGFPF